MTPISSQLPDPRSEHRTEPVPQVPDTLAAYIYAALVEKVFYVAQRMREPDVEHCFQAVEVNAGFKETHRVRLAHPKTLCRGNLRLKQASSDKTVGIICCRDIDAEGQEIGLTPTERLICAETKDVRETRKKLIVFCGTDRCDATLAALRESLVTHLRIDSAPAKARLDAR